MNGSGAFYGIGVGPGERGLLPVLAWEVLQHCGAIFVPRATSQDASTAKACLPENAIPEERFYEVEFDMSTDHAALLERYTTMAAQIAAHLRAGRDVAYLTLGDSMTYSTFNYTLRAVREACPEAPWRVFPGVSSYAALAAATGFPLGEGKERVLILPCPEGMDVLERALERHDITVLMKIGRRLPAVLSLLERMGLAEGAAFGGRVGMPDSLCQLGITNLLNTPPSGYLSTMLIRNPAPLPL
jgi:precorrin-2/cobalt-factor-2 C20-methyltransferase